jgi:hypothetical protein
VRQARDRFGVGAVPEASRTAITLYADDHQKDDYRRNQDGEDAEQAALHQGYKRSLRSQERDNSKGLT